MLLHPGYPKSAYRPREKHDHGNKTEGRRLISFSRNLFKMTKKLPEDAASKKKSSMEEQTRIKMLTCMVVITAIIGISISFEVGRDKFEMMIEGLDEDGDGTVTEEEFLHMMVPIVEKEEENSSMEDVAKRMFEILDDDHSGAVTTSEFKETLAKLGVIMSYEEVRELFHEYDDDLDGLMDEEEFVNMMTHQL